ncbi:MAG: PilZ domain-containing protein [Xanthobacteraceae bacterium]
MRKSKEYGGRKHERVDLRRPAFVALAPNGPWLECTLLDISEGGAGLDVGPLPLPKIFLLILTRDGKVRRTCLTAWRRGPLLGATFISLKQSRQNSRPQNYIDPRLQKMPINDSYA